MTTELQADAVELQQSESKRAELLPDEVEKAVTAFKFCISLIRDECLWSAGSFDKPHITTKNLKDVMAHIAAQSSEIERLRDSSRMLVTIAIQALERLSINPTERTSYLLQRLDIAINGVQSALAQGAKK